jgi:hypothetical protein
MSDCIFLCDDNHQNIVPYMDKGNIVYKFEKDQYFRIKNEVFNIILNDIFNYFKGNRYVSISGYKSGYKDGDEDDNISVYVTNTITGKVIVIDATLSTIKIKESNCYDDTIIYSSSITDYTVLDNTFSTWWNEMISSYDNPLGSLTLDERKCMDCLTDSWNEYHKLPTQCENDDDKFNQLINDAHKIVVARIARRISPDVWGINE